jgi:Trm5-related predicted tRNA methylase
MVARKRLTAIAVGLSVGPLAQLATGAEALVVHKAPAVTEFVVDTQTFRNEIDGYVRELNRQLRTSLNEDLRRELAPKIVLSSNPLRTRS